MSEISTFEEVAERQGWTGVTQVEVLLKYIENQKSPEAFEDFLILQQRQENMDETL